MERKTGKVHYEIEALPQEQRNRWHSGPFFQTPSAGPVSAFEVWERLNAWGKERLLAERLKRRGTLDIESGYGAFRTPAIETENDLSALEEQVDYILASQDPEGWWSGTCDGTRTISSAAFTRNMIRLLTYVSPSSPRAYASKIPVGS